MAQPNGTGRYFPYSIQVSRGGWEAVVREDPLSLTNRESREPFVVVARRIAGALARLPAAQGKRVTGGEINLFALLNRVYRHIIYRYQREQNPGVLERGGAAAGFPVASPPYDGVAAAFADHYPPYPDAAGEAARLVREGELPVELLILRLSRDNPALVPYLPLFDDRELAAEVPSRPFAAGIEAYLATAPPFAPLGLPLPEVLRAPMKASPTSLAGQIDYIKRHWQEILPPELQSELLTGLDVAGEEERQFFAGPGQPQVLEFLRGGRLGKSGYEYPEYERFSVDADWMANVVMIAKMTYVWLDQLGRKYGRTVHRLDQIPDEELDLLARWGFTSLWLIGVWERSPASRTIKHIGGNTEAISSAYSLYDYVIAADLGGEAALADLKERCGRRGIRLASDMVPNHTGIFSRWTMEHPDWFVQLDYPPYPVYSYTGPDLSSAPEVTIQIEDGYWTRTEAAVVFRHYDHRSGRTRYIYHGNDGTSTPWNDTAQLNYLIPEVREAVIGTILHVARQFPVIRFDAAMTLAKKHYQRLWYPQPGHGSGVPSRAEHGMTREEFDHVFPEEFWREVVDRVAVEAPGTLLLAEAFWLMEGYFVRTLGMHRVYNSAFMNMLKMEENAKYRQTVKNVLEFDPEILKRFVNFMNNPDERTAVEQFGKEGKYFGAAVLLATMPGLPMFGHGQVEGFHEKYGMEYRRAMWDEAADEHLVRLHEEQIFPLLRRRHIFSGSASFVFYDFFAGSHVNEDVFAYSNGSGGDHGLIVYHNRFASTSGWIRSSTGMMDKGAGKIVQKTLGDALGIDGGDGIFYTFRDYARGLEYLRSGRELRDQGLFVELEAFQYYTFLDFRRIVDVRGEWDSLCRRLNGRAVPSLEEEMKEIRYAPLLDRFRVVVSLLVDRRAVLFEPTVSETLREETLSLLTDETASFFAALAEAGLPAEGERSAAFIVRAAEVVAATFGAEETGAEGAAFPPPSGTWEDRFFAALLLLEGAATLLLLHDGSWAARFGLARAVADFCAGDEGSIYSGAAQPLLYLLLGHGRLFSEGDAETVAERGVKLFADPEVQQFLFVHRSGDDEWFNRERWELLLRWLAIAAAIGEGVTTGEGERVAAVLHDASEATIELAGAAAEARYRVRSFLDLLKKVSDVVEETDE